MITVINSCKKQDDIGKFMDTLDQTHKKHFKFNCEGYHTLLKVLEKLNTTITTLKVFLEMLVNEIQIHFFDLQYDDARAW